ncbi:cytochrome c oxidase subunit 3 [Pustulibacterium marinum]|uniref:Cytochrome c oxidase subunit 3 n=1 Tax=Pustulibacterium marinum TaxID=1224947 RepID=A0A1I7H9W8_9FLAO|nr:cytochrome c oxidase subunit 3 [Pustulibacterium marinum]SFU57508.1 cytochrome c oxidase subunit 3 [Pustulibacterium marinum]
MMMDLTQGTETQKIARAKKMMLWFAIISLFMMFAGLTSAYLVSSERKDWLTSFQIPSLFLVSTAMILISSITMHLAWTGLSKGNRSSTSLFLGLTLLLGIGFIVCQFLGFQELIAQGYFFTGPASNVTTSFVYLIAVLHILHVVAGLIVLLVVIYNHYKQRYQNGQTLGFELGVTFWHFLDVLWLMLISFFYFV